MSIKDRVNSRLGLHCSQPVQVLIALFVLCINSAWATTAVGNASVQSTSANLQADQPPQQALQISDAFFRLPIPGRAVSSAYLDITNVSAKPVELVAFYADRVKKVELHQHIHQQGLMKMRRVDGYRLEADNTLQLVPGGYHLMLFDVEEGLTSDDKIQFEIHLADGSKVHFSAVARDVLAKP